jgi:uncharacterized membrane-anchored protein
MNTKSLVSRRSAAVPMSTKVPAATASFWVTKALTTGMGESTSDYFVHRFAPVAAVAVAAVAFVAALALQFRVRRYISGVYWLAVAMVGVFGTMAADVLHVQFGVPYAVSATSFAVALVVIFGVWYRVEGTLSIHSIDTSRREVFYWLAVMTTFALGTAVGDLTAVTLHLGYFSSGLMFVGAIAIPALGYWRLGLDPIVAFWSAYIVTRPLGASFADWMGVSRDRGGLALGSGWVSLVLAILIVGLVSWMSLGEFEAERPSRH